MTFCVDGRGLPVLACLGGTPAVMVVLVVVIYRTQKYIWRADIVEKGQRQVPV
jgi:hypothetical protein